MSASISRSLRSVPQTNRRPDSSVSSRLSVSNSSHGPDLRFRPFFIGSLCIGLIAGAGWGVAMLLQILFGGRFTAVSIHQMNAHAHAQIYGFVGLLILGFAYEAFPRLWAAALPATWLRLPVFIAMLVGVALHVVGWWLGATREAIWLSSIGGMVETLALLVFFAQIVTMRARSPGPFGLASLFIVVSTALLVLHAAAETVYSVSLAGVGSRAEMLTLISVWQAPLRNLQLHGAMLLMIVGVAMDPAEAVAWLRKADAMSDAGEKLAAERRAACPFCGSPPRRSCEHLLGTISSRPWTGFEGEDSHLTRLEDALDILRQRVEHSKAARIDPKTLVPFPRLQKLLATTAEGAEAASVATLERRAFVDLVSDLLADLQGRGIPIMGTSDSERVDGVGKAFFARSGRIAKSVAAGLRQFILGDAVVLSHLIAGNFHEASKAHETSHAKANDLLRNPEIPRLEPKPGKKYQSLLELILDSDEPSDEPGEDAG